MRAFVFVATLVLTLLIFLIQSAMKPLCFGCLTVLYLSLVIYMFFLHIGSFEAGTFFSIVSFFPVIFLTLITNVLDLGSFVGALAILSGVLWIIAIPISNIVSKISGRFIKPKQYQLSYADVVEMCDRFNSYYTTGSKNQAYITKTSGGKIYVRVTDADGGRDSWGKHAFSGYCSSTFGVDLNHSNVQVDS